MKRVLSVVLVIALMCAGLFAGGEQESGAVSPTAVRVGDNLPDRTSGLGLVFETINNEFLEMHPELTFETESLPDQPWQEKVLVYASSNQLPDIFKYWSFPAMMGPLVESDYLAPLDREAMSAKGFMSGSLENNMMNGELYGIPVNADLWVIYYNKALFEKAKVKLPQTIDDIFAAADKFKAINVAPMATNGMDAWPLVITYDALVQRYSGDFGIIQKALDRKAGFDDEPFLKAAEILQEMTAGEQSVFQDDLMVSDYGAARNLFGQQRAAMYIMGSWEMGLAKDENFPESFRDNVGVLKFPVVSGGRGSADDLVAWYGGNVVVKAGPNSEIGMEYIDYFADRYPQLAWELQATFPAQAVAPSDSDTGLSKGLLAIAEEASSTSGTPSLDRSDAQFKDAYQKLISELCIGIISPEEFVSRLDREAQAAFERS